MGGSLVSGLMGAVIAVVGLGAIGQMNGAQSIPLIGSLYSTSSPASGSASTEIDALRAQIEALSSTGNVDLGALQTRLDGLEAQIDANVPGNAGSDELIGRIQTLETQLAEQETATGSNLDGAIDALGSQMAELGQRLTMLETSTTSETDSQDLATLSQSIEDLAGRLAELRSTVDTNTGDLEALASQSRELEDAVGSVKASEKVARSVAVNALSTALENDDPLSVPIASLEALAGEMPETLRLAELARSGLPSRRMLADELDLFSQALANPDQPEASASLSDRFWANAQKLVTFRSTGPREGDDPLAVLTRVKAAVLGGQLAQAEQEWNTLPDAIRQQGAAWYALLEKRKEAYALRDALQARLVAEAG